MGLVWPLPELQNHIYHKTKRIIVSTIIFYNLKWKTHKFIIWFYRMIFISTVLYNQMISMTNHQLTNGTRHGVSLMYRWYSGRLPHFFNPAFSSKGIPDSRVIKRYTKKGDNTDKYWNLWKTDDAEMYRPNQRRISPK